VDYAARLAEDLTAELIFVNVINQRDINMVKQVTMYTDQISVKSYVDGLKQDRTEEMQKLVEEKNCTRIPNRFIIKTGTPFEELIRAADQEKAGMVVMGTKGRGNIAGILLGSQAEKMFRHCPVPLLSIR
jgi:nucleotide-binding universal stress UspA family protein